MITTRDSNLIAYVAASKEVSVDFLAKLFFAHDPQTGRENRKPRAAAVRRLAMLRDAGFINVVGSRAAVTRKGAAHVHGAVSDPCPVSMRAHHDATLAAVEHYRRYSNYGASITDVVLEKDVRGDRMRGYGVAKRKIGSLPDAVINVRTPTGPKSIALEYVTTKYTDAMIEEKLSGFQGKYDDVVFYADAPATAARVMRLTGMGCTWS